MDEEYLSDEEFEKELNDDSGLFSNDDDLAHLCKIRIFGIGGGGNNAVNHMIEANLTGVEFYVANTVQYLCFHHNPFRLLRYQLLVFIFHYLSGPV